MISWSLFELVVILWGFDLGHLFLVLLVLLAAVLVGISLVVVFNILISTLGFAMIRSGKLLVVVINVLQGYLLVIKIILLTPKIGMGLVFWVVVLVVLFVVKVVLAVRNGMIVKLVKSLSLVLFIWVLGVPFVFVISISGTRQLVLNFLFLIRVVLTLCICTLIKL